MLVNPDDLHEGWLEKPTVFPCSKQIAARPKFFKTKIGRVKPQKIEEVLRLIASRQTDSFYTAVHKPVYNKPFSPGNTSIPYAGRVFDEKEISNLVESSLDFWLTAGRYADKFEKAFAKFLGVKHCSLTNSGSSANLLAFMALTSPRLGERSIKRGDEVITVAAGFPTTVVPIIQYGAVPVFVDVTFPTYNIDCSQLETALSEKTKAIMVAHTIGNPFDLNALKSFCDKYNLWLIEDNCDALGSKYLYKGKWRFTGTIGHIGTSSFYPPHHMTMGEGGAVYTNDARFKRLIESFRDWGRDCWCPSGRDNTCGNRFSQQFGELPYGYDHKYVYSHFGYNLKVTDMQAAIGCAQLEKLPSFIEARKRNWKTLRDGLSDLADKFILQESTEGSDPSWFGFLLTVKEGVGFTRDDIVNHLESKGIQTRMLFAGNLIKHPCFDEMRKIGAGYRVIGNLENTDRIMRDTFWIGVYPGVGGPQLDYIIATIRNYVRKQ
ncbi:MAG: lipopolysaccharide biosynthesis protein RfbH [Planctomycetes bacterium]|nr:lipopolysaccharide biosynthesis protein RfbH [Planctomycetota bacterium]